MGGTYRAWNDKTYRWPPPDGWYRDDDGIWWAPGTGPRPPGRRPATTVHSPTPNRSVRLDRTVPGTRSPTAPTVSAVPVLRRRSSRLRRAITKVVVVASGMTLAVLSGAGILAILVTTGHLSDVEELQDLRDLDIGIRLDASTDPTSAVEPTPAAPVPTTIIELNDPEATPLGPSPETTPPTILSEPRATTEPSANRADFDELAEFSAPPSARFRLGLGLG